MSSRGAFQNLIATPMIPELGPQRRAGVLGADELNRALDAFFDCEKISAGTRLLLRSAALLWHDHLDASHTISQGIETRDGSWLHGIMHRREPDYGNAKYWFRRVGQHPAFPELARRVRALSGNDEWAGHLAQNDEWMAFAFIDECERAEQGREAMLRDRLRQIQAAEFDVLIQHIFAHSS